MHVGRVYPYHFDIWPVTALKWPGWVPRNVTIGFPIVMPVGLTFLAGFVAVSAIGEPDADWEKVDYHLPELPPGVAEFVATLRTFPIGDAKWYDAGMTITMVDDNVLEIGNRLLGPRTTPFMRDLSWRELNHVPIDPVYVGGSIAPTPWHELSPPTTNANLGRWIQSGV